MYKKFIKIHNSIGETLMNNVFKKRIDELGRIVIPKQVRDNLKINNFDELDMYVDDDAIVLRKSIGIEMYKEKIERLLDFIKILSKFEIIVANKNRVIVSTNKGVVSNDEIVIKDEYSCNEVLISFKSSSDETVDFVSYCLPIIVDSSTLGQIFFVNDGNDFDKELLKIIKDLVIDLVI